VPDAAGRIPPVSYSGKAGATLERILSEEGDSPEIARPGEWVEDETYLPAIQNCMASHTNGRGRSVD
jgi:hypothetical protein